MSESNQHLGYFSDRCPKTVFGNDTAWPCSLRLNHEGPCEPIPLPLIQDTSSQQQEPQPGDTVRVKTADGTTRIKKVALQGVVLTSDFPVVWVRELAEPDTEPGRPWPYEDVEVVVSGV